jgi:hypothetical protein
VLRWGADADALRLGDWIERGVQELVKRIRVRGKGRWVRIGGFGGGGGRGRSGDGGEAEAVHFLELLSILRSQFDSGGLTAEHNQDIIRTSSSEKESSGLFLSR